jgi:hypothetical protein
MHFLVLYFIMNLAGYEGAASFVLEVRRVVHLGVLDERNGFCVASGKEIS